MAAYMKTEMPFYGVQKAGRTPVIRAAKKQFPPHSQQEYEANVLALWALPHREEKHVALAYARAFKRYQVLVAMPLYERLIREGQWWDFVDDVASNLVGTVWLRERNVMGPRMDAWILDEDIWIRRTAVIGQLKHREKTDVERLLRYCRIGAPEKVFWMRKAIGWALREHSKRDPETVRAFLDEMGQALSGLSRREAAKYIGD